MKVTFSLLTYHGVIKAGIDEEASGEEIIDFQVKRILPLHLHLAVVREVVETGDPGNLLTDVPLAVDGDVRTSFPFRVAAGIDAKGGREFFAIHILKLQSQRRDGSTDVEVFLGEFIVHTDGEQRFKR